VIGNVWEWCSDWWDEGFYTKPEAGKDPECKGGIQTYRILRGGSWIDDPQFCRAALRGGNAPDDRLCDFGFRVCVARD